jgi:hypothetical protein
MKKFIQYFYILGIITLVSSCDRDEGKLPSISFKTGGSYISADITKQVSSTITMGIDASKSEDKDLLKKFNISRSVNGAAAVSVFSKDLTGTEGDVFSNDYTTTLDTTANQTNKYTFTVTNRDGLVNQVSLTVTTAR